MPVKIGSGKKHVWQGHKPAMSDKSKLRAIAKKQGKGKDDGSGDKD